MGKHLLVHVPPESGAGTRIRAKPGTDGIDNRSLPVVLPPSTWRRRFMPTYEQQGCC